MSGKEVMLKGLRYSDLNAEFFQTIVDNIKPGARLTQYDETPINIESTDGILSSCHDKEVGEAIVGLKAFRLSYHSEPGTPEEKEECKDIVLKVKKEGAEMLQDWNTFFGPLDKNLKDITNEVCGNALWKNTTLCDLYSNELKQIPLFKAIMPTIYHIIDDRERHIYAYVMDNFASPVNGYSHLNMGPSAEKWTHNDVLEVLKCLANVHACFLDDTDKIPITVAQYLDPVLDMELFEKLRPYIVCHHDIVMRNRPEYFPEDILDTYSKAFANTDEIFDVLDKAPKTLTHGDCTIRNMCKRNIEGQEQICLYDWEMAKIAVPQRDFIDFMQLWLPADVTMDTWYKYLDIYRIYLQEAVALKGDASAIACKKYLEWDTFKEVTDMCFLEYFMSRSQMYMSCSILIETDYIKRCIAVWHPMLRYLKHEYAFLK